MQDSRKNNVVALSPLGQGRGSARAEGAAILNECGEIAATGLASALGKVLEHAASELLELTDRVTVYETRRLYVAAMDFARDQRAIVETEFQSFSADFLNIIERDILRVERRKA